MAMQVASLEVLEKAQVPPAQARAIVQAIEIELAGAKDTLATKQDLSMLGHELRHEMAQMGSDLRREMAEMRSDLRTEIHAASLGNLRHLYAAITGQFALLLGVAYFFVSHLQH